MLRSAAVVLATLLVLLPAGCNIVGPAVYFIHGPAKVQPQYELPEDRPAVVFIDDRTNVLPNRAVRQRVAKAAERTLLDGKAVAKSEIVSSDAILPVATQERFGRPAGIAEIGEAVGAQVVVYATIDGFSLSPNGAEFAPIALARVKVVDAQSKQRLWPGTQSEWHPVRIQPATRTRELPRSLSERTKAEIELAEELGRNIARLFVEYSPEEVSQRVGETGPSQN